MLDKLKADIHDCGCEGTDCTCGKRNRFFRWKRMKAADFAIEQAYGIERRRIINRSVIGAGVVNGFAMTTGESKVGPGFAIDRHGREIVLAHETAPGRDNLFLVGSDSSGCRTLALDQAKPDAKYLLRVHYAERRFGDAKLPDNCGCDEPEKNYVCETAVFSLCQVDECPCGEKKCHRTCDCEITDGCGEPLPPPGPGPYSAPPAYTSGDTAELPPPESNDYNLVAVRPPSDSPSSRGGRGPHACLCHWLMEAPIDCTRPTLCDWNGYAIDPSDGIPLACVTIRKTDDKCRPLEIYVTDPCGPRHFIKSNDLLYDFIRGCDLAHISWVSWQRWHRHSVKMPWELFASLFREDDGWTAFAVRFSGPVLAETIRLDSVAMHAVTAEQATDWRVTRGVPIVKLDLNPYRKDLPDGTTDQLRFYVSTDWIKDEIVKERSSWLTNRGFDIVIEIFGDGILDCHRQPIDGEAIGLHAVPSGNGSPGGTYRSSFCVEPKPGKQY